MHRNSVTGHRDKIRLPILLLVIFACTVLFACRSMHKNSPVELKYGCLSGRIVTCDAGLALIAASFTFSKYADTFLTEDSPDHYEIDTAFAPRKIESDSTGYFFVDSIPAGLYMGLARGAPYNRIDDGGLIKAEMLARESCAPVRIILIRISRDSVTSFEIKLPRTTLDWSNEGSYFQETVTWDGDIMPRR
jgi:hypothetical protein